ncbi:hypothetical protein PR048_013353, partial [Dryococelus australis]
MMNRFLQHAQKQHIYLRMTGGYFAVFHAYPDQQLLQCWRYLCVYKKEISFPRLNPKPEVYYM